MVEKSLATVTPERKIGAIHDVHIKPFQELQQHVQTPQIDGVVGSTVDALNQMIGVSSLYIEHIAKELNVSKRTLQRHLRKNNSNFLVLRDKVCFKHAMICLLEKQMSIESTASYLHFSDRTSFTNAFKRWSGHSPSYFRKIYGGNKV